MAEVILRRTISFGRLRMAHSAVVCATISDASGVFVKTGCCRLRRKPGGERLSSPAKSTNSNRQCCALRLQHNQIAAAISVAISQNAAVKSAAF
jgi:hypothetical protein